MMTQEEEASPVGCCCTTRPNRRVTPFSESSLDFHFVETRPGRRLAVYHRNSRARDAAFQTQYDNYLQHVHKKTDLRQEVIAHLQQTKKQREKENCSNFSYNNRSLTLEDENVPPDKKLQNGLPSNKHGLQRSMSHSEWMLNFKNSPKKYVSGTVSNPITMQDQIPGFRKSFNSPTKSHGITGEASRKVPNIPQTQSKTNQYISDQVDVNTLKHVSLEMYQHRTNELLDRETSSRGQPNSPPNVVGSRENSFSSNTIKAGSDESCVFLLHGVGGSAAVWTAQDEYLTDRNYEVIIPDLLGHGNSAAPMDKGAYEFEEISTDLLALFDRFCKKRNVIIGHSYGCSFAVKLCRQRSKYINKLIMVSGGSPSPLAPQPGIFSMPLCFLCCCQHVLSRGFRKSAFHSKKSYIPQDNAFDVPPHVLKYTMNGQNWPEGGIEYHMSLNIPTLIIHGEEDRFVSLEEEREMHQVVYGSELMLVKEASHMVMLEQPEVVNELIEKFLCKVAPLPGSTTQHLVQEGFGLINQENNKPEMNSPQNVVSPRRSLSAKFRRSSRPAVATLNGSQLSLRSVKTIPANLVTANLP